MTLTVRDYRGIVIDVHQREREAFRRGRLRGEHDRREGSQNPTPLSGESAGESIPELLGDLWVDLAASEVPEWYLETICDQYENGYQNAFEQFATNTERK